MSAPLKICFVALNGYAAIGGRAGTSHIGGAERQTALLARELARRGHMVSLVVLDHGQADGEAIQGVRVFKAYARDAGLPGLRFFSPRLTGLWSALRRASADVYYQRMAEQTTGIVAAFCRRHGKRFFFASASDYDCLPELPRLRKPREAVLYRYGLRRADRVLVQTRHQREMMRTGFGVEAEVLSNAAEDLADRSVVSAPGGALARDAGEASGRLAASGSDRGAAPDARGPEVCEPRLSEEFAVGGTKGLRVLWIGRYTPEKRLEWVFEIAGACSNLTFDIVGDATGGSRYAEDLKARAKRCENVRLLGRVAHEQIGALYRRSDVLLCTSEREGFPNTFLEAWSLGVPVVTTFDPDGVVAEFGLGRVATCVPGVIEALQVTAADGVGRERMRVCCRAYFEREHRVERVVDRFEALLAGTGSAV
ncbi:MAG: glycosyltransferase family 4 protein [Phycisphaerae bacterium]|nr:glycosyltransferase family 4 protein [Phycisphaerae bacterium]NUQ09862.1 glycosyltransferase family 4 protein [Phycisphaerae bacterium]